MSHSPRKLDEGSSASHSANKPKPDKKLCDQVPQIYDSFVDVIFDHAVGKVVLGPTKNPSRTFFSSPHRGDVWNAENWGRYPDPDRVVSHLPAAARLIAIGDLHGDLDKTREVLRLSKLLSLGDDETWTGGNTTLVQVGDIFDRGGDELRICYLLEKLKREAARAGGAVHVLHGNHETLNMSGKFTFVHPAGFYEFDQWFLWWQIQESARKLVPGCPPSINYIKGMPVWSSVHILKDQIPRSHFLFQGVLGRMLAMRPGGPVSKRFFGNSPTILVVGKSVFVHAGIRPEVVTRGMRDVIDYNQQVCDWVKGLSGLNPPEIVQCFSIRGKPNTAVTWNREWGQEEGDLPCDELKKTLAQLEIKRMLIGHTIQRNRGLNAKCQGRVIRIDVGMSKGCGGRPPQALEILHDKTLRLLSQEDSKALSVSVDPDEASEEELASDADSGEISGFASEPEAPSHDAEDQQEEPSEPKLSAAEEQEIYMHKLCEDWDKNTIWECCIQ